MDRIAQQTMQDLRSVKPLDLLQQSPFLTLIAALGFCLLSYIAYYRFYVPAAKYHGPLLASVSDLWQALNSKIVSPRGVACFKLNPLAKCTLAIRIEKSLGCTTSMEI